MPSFIARIFGVLVLFALGLSGRAFPQAVADTAAPPLILAPDAVWDGVADSPHAGWLVVVRGQRIEAVGPADRVAAPAGAGRGGPPSTTLLPGPVRRDPHPFLPPPQQKPSGD